MKKKVFGIKIKRIFAAFGCLILALLFWLIVKYGQTNSITDILLNFS